MALHREAVPWIPPFARIVRTLQHLLKLLHWTASGHLTRPTELFPHPLENVSQITGNRRRSGTQ